MKPAFNFVGPRPASGSRIFPGTDRAGARLATDARILPVMQRIVRNLMIMNISPDLFGVPESQGIQLEQPKPLIPLHHLRMGTGGGLFTPDSGDPSLVVFQHFFQRLNFAELTVRRRISPLVPPT
jgi:hypothetical protein